MFFRLTNHLTVHSYRNSQHSMPTSLYSLDGSTHLRCCNLTTLDRRHHVWIRNTRHVIGHLPDRLARSESMSTNQFIDEMKVYWARAGCRLRHSALASSSSRACGSVAPKFILGSDTCRARCLAAPSPGFSASLYHSVRARFLMTIC